MRPVSPAWSRTVTRPHQAIFRATVCDTFQTGTTPDGTRIKILGGDVELNGTADIRSTLDLKTAGATMWPRRSDDLLVPYGNELYVERGIKYSDALVEYVGLGYFRIETPEQDEPPDGPIQITGSDRMAGIIDGRLVRPQQFRTTASFGFVVETLVQQVYPDAVVVWDDPVVRDSLLARSLICDDDRYGFLDGLVRSVGKVWYWDHAGRLSIKSMPSPSTPVAELVAGRGGVLLKLRRQLTRRGVCNAVVASGEAVDTYDPVSWAAIDDDPDSPTYYYGRFGPVPKFLTNPAIFSPAQARTAAEAELRKHLGLPYSLTMSVSPNPALEPWDPVDVRAAERDSVETHVLETLKIPLTARGAMTGTTREQTIVLIGST